MYLLQLRDGSSELFNLAHILRAVKNTDAQGDFTQILLKYPDTVETVDLIYTDLINLQNALR